MAEKSAKTDAGVSEVQERHAQMREQGFDGVRTDPTPLENYTVAGVVAGKPTPETDEKAAAEAGRVFSKFSGTPPAA